MADSLSANRKESIFLEDDSPVWEQAPMPRLVEAGQLRAYRHHGPWQGMDTLRDEQVLEDIWATGNAPRKVWEGLWKPIFRSSNSKFRDIEYGARASL